MTAMEWVFLITAAVTLVAAVMVVTSPNLVHAALWLILSLAGIAVAFLLLEAGFLAVVQVVIYIGAIAILIIFGVMMTRRVMADTGPQVNDTWWLAAIAAVLLFAGLMTMFGQVPRFAQATLAPLRDQGALLRHLGRALVDVDMYVLPFELASILLLAALVGAMVVARPPADTPDEGGEA